MPRCGSGGVCGLLLGPYSSEAKGQVGDHGTDETTPVETQLTS